MLTLKLAFAAGIAAWIVFQSWKMGLATAIIVMVWRPAQAVTHTIFILNHETGEMTAQVHDASAEKYLKDK